MDFRFYRATPDANVQFPAFGIDGDPPFTLVVLQRSGEPDTAATDGWDYFGAYGLGSEIDTWAAGQPVTALVSNELPNPPTFYPAPFNEA